MIGFSRPLVQASTFFVLPVDTIKIISFFKFWMRLPKYRYGTGSTFGVVRSAMACKNSQLVYEKHSSLKPELIPLTETRLPDLRALIAVLFPVRYPEAFYSHILNADPALTRLVYADSHLVAVLCCGLDPPNDMQSAEHEPSVYIFTLGVIAPYREQGIGSALLRHAINTTKAMGRKRLFAHVQQSNTDAIRLYTKFGFVTKTIIPNYYKRIDPPHAVLVELDC